METHQSHRPVPPTLGSSGTIPDTLEMGTARGRFKAWAYVDLAWGSAENAWLRACWHDSCKLCKTVLGRKA